MADNYRLPKTPAGDDGSGPLIKTKQNGDLSHSQGIVVCDASGNIVDVLSSAPAGTERGVVTRNIPSGTQPVSDGGGSLTVDAPAATPVAVRPSDGTSYLGSTAGRAHVDDGGSSLTVDSPQLPLSLVSGRFDVNVGASTTVNTNVASALPTGTNQIGSVFQEKPPGYANRSINTVVAGVAGGTTEGLVSMVSSLAGVDSAANTVFTVTAGKTFRITGLWVAVANGAATQNAVRIYLRATPTAPASATSPIQAILGVSAPNAVSGGMDGISSPPLDIDIPSGWGFAVTRINAINSGTIWVSLTGYEFTT